MEMSPRKIHNVLGHGPKHHNICSIRHMRKYIGHFRKVLRSLPHTPQLLKVHMNNITSTSGANLGPVGQYDLTFRLVNKQCADQFIVLQDACRNVILGLIWKCNYRIGCNWNINGLQYITHNN